MTQPAEVLSMWFGNATGAVPPPEVRKQWWKKDPAFDAELRTRFGAIHDEASAGGLTAWEDTARGTMALIILLDQFSRNLYRGDGRAFANDARALALVDHAVAKGFAAQLGFHERSFLWMPLMHAEDSARQAECIERMEQLADDAPADLAEGFRGNAVFGEKHKVIIDRFGRFPHRNAALGRESTDEEVEFLKQPGSSF